MGRPNRAIPLFPHLRAGVTRPARLRLVELAIMKQHVLGIGGKSVAGCVTCGVRLKALSCASDLGIVLGSAPNPSL